LREPRAVIEALSWCDGVMLGREAYHRPYLLAELQRALHPGAGAAPTREALTARMQRYASASSPPAGASPQSRATCSPVQRRARGTRLPAHAE